MFSVGICEDDTVQQKYLEQSIIRWADSRHKKIVVQKYESSEQFLFENEGLLPFDLLILDIQMGRMNGMELAKKIREKNKSVQIVFLTGLKEYALEGYEVGAVRYLIKPLKQDALDMLLDGIWQESQKVRQESYVFTCNGETCRIAYDEIVYVEANGHYLNMVTAQNAYQWKASFTSVSQDFEKMGFFLLRRGLYVNLEYVRRISGTDCILESGEVLPVSKSRYRKLNEAFIAYYRGMTE